MSIKLLGALCVVIAGGGFGFSMAAGHQQSEKTLQQLLRGIEFMISELEYRLTPLPQLCRMAAKEAGGQVGKILLALALTLEQQQISNVTMCMDSVVERFPRLPVRTERNMLQLGRSLGRFALEGQVAGLRSCVALCQRDLQSLSVDRDVRLRSYRTLGLCGGIALAILLL